MNPILQSIIFMIALSGSVYFLSSLSTWMVTKIAPENCKKEMTNKEILISNIVAIITIVLWSILFYLNLVQ